MKHVNKGVEPRSLTHYRANDPYPTYEGYREKDDLRHALLIEQGDICCYCMERIKTRKMKIEHWKPQTKCENLQLDYRNLLGACLGREGQPQHLQHCDTRKGNELITINPTDENCESLVKFSKSGEIYSDNEEINKDLNDALNLNMRRIVENRKARLDKALMDFGEKYPGKWTKDLLKREIRRWSPKQGPYKPYCQIVVFFLKKRLARCD